MESVNHNHVQAMPVVAGLIGLKGCGKSTVARVFADHGFVIVPFSSPLKAMLASLLQARGVSAEEISRMLVGDKKESPHWALNGRSPRQAMQWLGTEWGRDLMAGTFWVDAWRDQAMRHPRVVADDVRFPNEVEAIKAMGGTLIRIARPALVSGDTHISENLITSLKADRQITNDGDLADLEFAARGMVEAVLVAHSHAA